MVEGDGPTMKAIQITDKEQHIIDHIVEEMEEELGTDREAALADMRYNYIESICRDSVVETPRNS